MVHVPDKGLGAAYPDLLAGQIQLTFASITSALPHVRSQRLRPLAARGAERAKAAPELPTMIEAGVPGFVVTQWHGMLAPAATPREIINLLNAEIGRIVRLPEVRDAFATQGLEAASSTPEQFGAILREQIALYAKVINDAGIPAQ